MSTPKAWLSRWPVHALESSRQRRGRSSSATSKMNTKMTGNNQFSGKTPPCASRNCFRVHFWIGEKGIASAADAEDGTGARLGPYGCVTGTEKPLRQEAEGASRRTKIPCVTPGQSPRAHLRARARAPPQGAAPHAGRAGARPRGCGPQAARPSSPPRPLRASGQ